MSSRGPVNWISVSRAGLHAWAIPHAWRERGCFVCFVQHHCVYCDSRSECYQIENFDRDVLVKVNAIELLRKELANKRVKGPIGLGSMNDPFMPLPSGVSLTGQALAVIAEFGFPVHIITKSALVLEELETLQRISQVYASISFTITTADDALAAKIEPGSSRPSARFAAMKTLAARGIQTGVTMMPILPFIEDNAENITAIVEQAAANGASYIIPWMGMSLRDRQRAYYYEQLDALFPGVREKYERTYGDRYSCDAPNAPRLYRLFTALCEQYRIAAKLPLYQPLAPRQLGLWR